MQWEEKKKSIGSKFGRICDDIFCTGGIVVYIIAFHNRDPTQGGRKPEKKSDNSWNVEIWNNVFEKMLRKGGVFNSPYTAREISSHIFRTI